MSKRARLSPTILTLLIECENRELCAHVLGYAYRKAFVLARSCRFLRDLIKRRTFWRRGVRLELPGCRGMYKWPAVIVERLLEVFDPFFDEQWPRTQLKGEFPTPQWGETLQWMFVGATRMHVDIPYQLHPCYEVAVKGTKWDTDLSFVIEPDTLNACIRREHLVPGDWGRDTKAMTWICVIYRDGRARRFVSVKSIHDSKMLGKELWE